MNVKLLCFSSLFDTKKSNASGAHCRDFYTLGTFTSRTNWFEFTVVIMTVQTHFGLWKTQEVISYWELNLTKTGQYSSIDLVSLNHCHSPQNLISLALWLKPRSSDTITTTWTRLHTNLGDRRAWEQSLSQCVLIIPSVVGCSVGH